MRAIGVDTSARSSAPNPDVLMITDLDGNHIAFAETLTAEHGEIGRIKHQRSCPCDSPRLDVAAVHLATCARGARRHATHRSSGDQAGPSSPVFAPEPEINCRSTKT